jgi:RNA polymerase sigma-70 factor, ECF subfamily
MGREEDIKLVEEAKSDPQAFGRIFEIYYDRIFRYAAHVTSNADAAADISSEVFFKALKGIKKFKHTGAPFSAWLYRIAANECHNYFRAARYRPASYDAAIEAGLIREPASSRDTEKELEEAQKEIDRNVDYAKAKEMMDFLKPVYKDVLVLRFMEGMKLSEIAQVLDKKEGTIKSLLSRGIAAIKKRNQKRG